MRIPISEKLSETQVEMEKQDIIIKIKDYFEELKSKFEQEKKVNKF